MVQYVVEAVVLAKPSIFQRFCYSATWMPWPFPTTDILIRSQGYDLGEVTSPPQYSCFGVWLPCKFLVPAA